MSRARNRKNWKHLGYDFKSRIEQEVGKQLLSLGLEFQYEEYQYRYTIKVPTTFCGECGSTDAMSTRTYTPDFYIPSLKLTVECKGRFTAAERKKHAAFREQHPDEDLRILFQRNDWLTKRKKKSYGQWCDTKGILWAAGFTLPEDWIT